MEGTLRRLSSALSDIEKIRQSNSRVQERDRNVGLSTVAGRLTDRRTNFRIEQSLGGFAVSTIVS
jgi:hypothetical protein